MCKLKSMKNIKEFLIGDVDRTDECKNIMKSEMPHLIVRKFVGKSYDFQVAVTNTEDFERFDFCPNCHECDKYMVLKC